MPGVLFGPAMVGILVDHGNFSEEYAGWVMACGSFGSAITLLIISVYIHHLNLKQLAYVCLFFTMIIDIYSAFNAKPDLVYLKSAHKYAKNSKEKAILERKFVEYLGADKVFNVEIISNMHI
jgi:hypothetical protein